MSSVYSTSVSMHARYVVQGKAMCTHEVRLALPAVGEGAGTPGALEREFPGVRASVSSLQYKIWFILITPFDQTFFCEKKGSNGRGDGRRQDQKYLIKSIKG